MHQHSIVVPADVPEKKHDTFVKNYSAITRNTGRLFLFSCDHKIEHLNNDFYGTHINSQALHPEHLFRIASQGNIGAMATHLGLIARYAKQYPNVHYIAKLTATTNLIPCKQQDPMSTLLWDIDDVIDLRDNNKLMIAGVGVTVYLGSEFEAEHLSQAAQIITHAHSEGLVAIIWMYPRGKAICQENNSHLIAGGAGVALSLGADFVKLKSPETTDILSSAQAFKIASAAAGNTKIICSGGDIAQPREFLSKLYDQIHIGDIAGTATGRNIFQRSLAESVAFTQAISAIVYDNVDLKTSLAIIAT
jgi:fructose-bisphosphate aldolase / 6-deoxy-5-ketofructose 1-phosphate synthase